MERRIAHVVGLMLGWGVWAVVVPIATDDPEGDLARFRQALPDLADWSWIVSI